MKFLPLRLYESPTFTAYFTARFNNITTVRCYCHYARPRYAMRHRCHFARAKTAAAATMLSHVLIRSSTGKYKNRRCAAAALRAAQYVVKNRNTATLHDCRLYYAGSRPVFACFAFSRLTYQSPIDAVPRFYRRYAAPSVAFRHSISSFEGAT